MDFPDFETWVRIHQVNPIEPLKRSCQLTFTGRTQMYALRKQGEIEFVKNGARNGVTAETNYRLAKAKVEASKGGRS